jgi:hypothetical protein
MMQQRLSSSAPYKSPTAQLTSRTATTGINPPSGSRGAKKQYNHRAEIIRMPSGSIAPLEQLDLSQARFNRALMFALPVSFILWGVIGLSIWGLISVFF